MADQPQSLVASEAAEGFVTCDRCSLPVAESEMAAKRNEHTKQVECKSCRSLLSLLKYHVSPTEVFSKMSKDDVTGFFQRALEERKQNGGILKYEVVRANLLKHFQKRITDVAKRSAGGTYQPLSWWSQNGYDPVAVQEKGFAMTCPVFGSVYRVDLVTIKQIHAEEEAESQMVELEQRVSRKRTTTERAGNGAKRVKGRGKGKGKEDAPMIEEPSAQALADDEVLQSIVDLECASDDDVQIVLPKAGRGNTDKQAQRKREQELKKEHKTVSILAGKALPALQPVSSRLENLVKALEPKKEELPEMTVRLMHENKLRLEKMVHSFQQIMLKVGQNAAVNFTDVTFTCKKNGEAGVTVAITSEKELQSEIKSLQECCKALQIAKKNLGK